jgi:hypothetical protein
MDRNSERSAAMYQQHLNEVRAAQIQQDRRREAASERSLREASAVATEDEGAEMDERGVEPRPAGLRRLLHALRVLGRRRATAR